LKYPSKGGYKIFLFILKLQDCFFINPEVIIAVPAQTAGGPAQTAGTGLPERSGGSARKVRRAIIKAGITNPGQHKTN